MEDIETNDIGQSLVRYRVVFLIECVKYYIKDLYLISL